MRKRKLIVVGALLLLTLIASLVTSLIEIDCERESTSHGMRLGTLPMTGLLIGIVPVASWFFQRREKQVSSAK